MSPLVFWPSVLGLSVFAGGLYTYRGEPLSADKQSVTFRVTIEKRIAGAEGGYR